MIERVIQHHAGRFARCRSCNTEPRHVRTAGRSSVEPLGLVPTALTPLSRVVTMKHIGSIRHYLECRCGSRTCKHITITDAEIEWGSDFAQLTLPLRVSRRRKVAA
jgi:hypothetical protein